MRLIPDTTAARVMTRILQFDVRTPGLGVARAGIALAQILTLTLTPLDALTQTVAGRADPRACTGYQTVSALCIGEGYLPDELRVTLIVGLLILVAAGLYPRALTFVHSWICYSILTGITLPEGGDSIAALAG